MTTIIEITAIRPPKTGKKVATVVAASGQSFEIWPDKMNGLQEGGRYEVEVEEREWPTGAAHDHIRLVVPANVSGGPLCLCLARGRQNGRAQSGGSARLDEVAPACGRLIPKLGDLCFAFFDHD
jgi:hypothetical protein